MSLVAIAERQARLKLLCDEVLKEENFYAT